MTYINQSWAVLYQDINAIDAHLSALNASYAENLSLISAYMAFTNASIQLLRADLDALADKERFDIEALKVDLENLRNYTTRANDLLNGLVFLADANSTARDITLQSNVNELRSWTGNLTARAVDLEARIVNTNSTLSMDLDYEVQRLNTMITRLQNDLASNRTAMDKQISDAKNEGQGDLGLAVVLTFIAGVCVTLLAITAHNRSHNQQKPLANRGTKDEEE